MEILAEKGSRSRIRANSIALALLVAAAAFPLRAQAPASPARKPPTQISRAKPKQAARTASKTNAAILSQETAQKQLTVLARALRENPDQAAYSALSAFALKNAKNELGARAALALGYYDLTRGKSGLALVWLGKAVNDKLLREYIQYWQAQTSLALGQKEVALEQLESFRRDFPDSVLTEQVVAPLAQTALALGRPADALAALDALPDTAAKPNLLLLRSQAREKLAESRGEMPLPAASDYLDLYYRFPLSDEAKVAGEKIHSLQSVLGEKFPSTPALTEMARAETFFLAKRWREAQSEFAALLPKLSGGYRERAELRVAQCKVQSGGKPELLAELSLTDPDVDAERIFAISQAHRSHKLEAQMLDEIGQLSDRFPRSSWAQEGLFDAGNFYWVNLDRARAVEFYNRMLAAFPEGMDAPTAAWRVAWTAYLDRKPEAAGMIEDYVHRFPTASYVPDALYWLGRVQERSGIIADARGSYAAAVTRFPLTYFGAKAAERLRPAPEGIGAEPVNPSELISRIPAAPPLMPVDLPLTDKAEQNRARARALTMIAFDASAELEYRAAYALTRSPRLLLDAAAAADAAGRYPAGIVAMRRAFPELEARRISEIPIEAWRTSFPLPYEMTLRDAAVRSQVDPMLVAGVIRQESAFDSKAISRAGAIGLMQVMPKTGAKLARQLRLRYMRARLTDPGYNLQLGSRYLADLIRELGTPEAALAAYNAGEDRVAQWTAGQNYLETAEFVESIPFTETREYVQIVIRNAEVYRQVYDPVRAAESVPAGAPITSRIRSEQAGPKRPADRQLALEKHQ